MDPLLISFFTHKGGVGKTTGIHNIASILANEFDLRVLLIDADSQCSLTGVVMHKTFLDLGKTKPPISTDEKENIKYWLEEGEEMFYEAPNKDPTLKSKRRTIYECFINERLKEEWKHFRLYDNKEARLDQIEIQPVHGNKNLFILPGDLSTNALESPLSSAYTRNNDGVLDYIPGSIGTLFREIGKKHHIDIVLVDMNPGASAFNRSIVMGSDYFVVSNLPDYFSKRSITSLYNVLLEWDKTSDTYRNDPMFPLPQCPKYLGCIFNRVRTYKSDATQGRQSKITDIENKIHELLLSKNSPARIEGYQFRKSPIIKDFVKEGDKATDCGKPISYYFDNDDNPMFFNAFFCAVISIFSNLTPEHHKRFNNIFSPYYKQPWNRIVSHPDNSVNSFYGKLEEGETLKLERTPARDYLQALKDVKEVGSVIKYFKDHIPKVKPDEKSKKSKSMDEEMKPKASNGEVKFNPRLFNDEMKYHSSGPKLTPLKDKINKINKKLMEHVINNDKELKEASLDILPEWCLKETPAILKYLKLYISLKKAETTLNGFMRDPKEALEEYRKLIIQSNDPEEIPIGPNYMKVSTEWSNANKKYKHLRVWEEDKKEKGDTGKVYLKLVDQVGDKSRGVHLDILIKNEFDFDYLRDLRKVDVSDKSSKKVEATDKPAKKVGGSDKSSKKVDRADKAPHHPRPQDEEFEKKKKLKG